MTEIGQLLVEHLPAGHLLIWALARADTHSEQVSIRANVRAQLSGEQLSGSQYDIIDLEGGGGISTRAYDRGVTRKK